MIKGIWCWIRGFRCMHLAAPQMTETRNHYVFFFVFFSLIGIDLADYLKLKLHLTRLKKKKKKSWSSETTGSTCNCTAMSATLTNHYKTAFCIDTVSALIVPPFPQSGNRQQRNTAIFILGVYFKCHSQRVEVSNFGTKLCFEVPTLLFHLIGGPF